MAMPPLIAPAPQPIIVVMVPQGMPMPQALETFLPQVLHDQQHQQHNQQHDQHNQQHDQHNQQHDQHDQQHNLKQNHQQFLTVTTQKGRKSRITYDVTRRHPDEYAADVNEFLSAVDRTLTEAIDDASKLRAQQVAACLLRKHMHALISVSVADLKACAAYNAVNGKRYPYTRDTHLHGGVLSKDAADPSVGVLDVLALRTRAMTRVRRFQGRARETHIEVL